MHGVSDRRQWILFVIFWVIYLFHVGPIPGVNENRYIDLTMSIVDHGQLNIDQYHYNTVDKAYYNGHYYSGAAPGPSILAIPLYLVFETAQRFFPVSVFSQYDTGVYIRSEMGGRPASDDFVATYPFSDFVLLHIGFTWVICSGLAALIFRPETA